MRRRWITSLIASATALASLTACAAPENEPQSTSTATMPASEAPPPEPTELTEDGFASCEIFFEAGLLERIPDALTSIGDSLGGSELDELLDINQVIGEAYEAAPAGVAGPLESLKQPFQQVEDVVDAGGGSLNMDTSHVMNDVSDLMEECAALGYTQG
jgi:hypothetical protein